jgi:HAD superfamily hydrolase (TIGR01490 family)
MISKNIAIFDCCETIVNFQTADAFVSFIREQSESQKMEQMESKRLHFRATNLGQLLWRFGLDENKKKVASQLDGMPRESVIIYAESYLRNVLSKNFIPDTIELINKLKGQGYCLILISGGYWDYIKPLGDSLGFDYVISTHLKYKDGVCTGKFGKDCMGKQKVYQFKRFLKSEGILPKTIISISDSESDLPILRIADKSIVISRKHQKWVPFSDKFEEIIWVH